MRVAVFADIHSDVDGLEAVLADIGARGVDELWCLGDIVATGGAPAACVTLVRERCALVLAGNHDLWQVRDATAAPTRWVPPFVSASLDPGPPGLDAPTRAWLASLTPHAERHGVQCWHGGPKNPVMQWVATAQDAAPYLLTAGALTLVAHTHLPAAFLARPERTPRALRPRAGETVAFGDQACVLNPGAVARPQFDEDPYAYWMLLDLAQRQATWLAVSVSEPSAHSSWGRSGGGRRAA